MIKRVQAIRLFIEAPREWTVSARCKRVDSVQTWRGDAARWLCESVLRPVNPGHCN